MTNQHIVQAFYEKYYHDTTTKRVVLCGINPGRKGAGKTGVPFLDNNSLKILIPSVVSGDREISASFIYSIIQEIGVKAFFNKVYLTNFSWYGFVDKKGKNINYYQLEPAIQEKCKEHFVEEMRQVNPLCIIPLSKEVEKSLRSITELNIPIMERLPHPYWQVFLPIKISGKASIYSELWNAFKKKSQLFKIYDKGRKYKEYKKYRVWISVPHE